MSKKISLLGGAVKEDIAAVDLELEQRNADKSDAPAQKTIANKPKRQVRAYSFENYSAE